MFDPSYVAGQFLAGAVENMYDSAEVGPPCESDGRRDEEATQRRNRQGGCPR